MRGHNGRFEVPHLFGVKLKSGLRVLLSLRSDGRHVRQFLALISISQQNVGWRSSFLLSLETGIPVTKLLFLRAIRSLSPSR